MKTNELNKEVTQADHNIAGVKIWNKNIVNKYCTIAVMQMSNTTLFKKIK